MFVCVCARESSVSRNTICNPMCDHINHNIAASKRCGEHYHHLFNLLLLFVVRRLKMTMPTRANMWQPKSKNDKHQMQSQHMTWHFVSVRGCMRGRHLSLSHQCRHIGNVPTTVQNLLHGIRNGSSSAHTQCHCLFESIILCSRRTPSHFSSPWLLLPPPAHRIRRHTHIVFASFFLDMIATAITSTLWHLLSGSTTYSRLYQHQFSK